MSAPEEMVFRFENQLEPLKESMLLAGQALRVGAGRRVLTMVIGMGAAFLMAGGGAVFAVFAVILVGPKDFNVFVPALIGAVLGFGFFLRWYDGLIRIMAQSVLATPFNQGMVEMRFDRKGVTLASDAAQWHTRWRGIHKVRAGRTGVHVFQSGIALYVPKYALPGSVEELAEMLEGWREAAS